MPTEEQRRKKAASKKKNSSKKTAKKTTKKVVKKTTKKVAKKVAKKVVKKRAGVTAFIREKLSANMSPDEIMELIWEEFPDSKATKKDIYVTRSRMNSEA